MNITIQLYSGQQPKLIFAAVDFETLQSIISSQFVLSGFHYPYGFHFLFGSLESFTLARRPT